MYPSSPPLKLFTPIFVVLFLQVIILMMLGVNFASLTAYEQGSIANLPPVNFLYTTSDTSWIGAGRAIAHVLIALTNIAIGVLCLWYGMVRKVNVVRYVAIVMGLQFFTSSLFNLSITALISVGGWWHFVALGCIILMAVSSVATAVMFTLLHKDLRDLGTAHDMIIDRFHESRK